MALAAGSRDQTSMVAILSISMGRLRTLPVVQMQAKQAQAEASHRQMGTKVRENHSPKAQIAGRQRSNREAAAEMVAATVMEASGAMFGAPRTAGGGYPRRGRGRLELFAGDG